MPLFTASYADFKTAIAAFLVRSDLTARIDDFVRLAELRIQRELQVRLQDASVSGEIVAHSITLDGTAEVLSSTAATLGIDNEFTVGVFFKLTDADAIGRYICALQTGANNLNRLVIARGSAGRNTLEINLYDSAGVLFKNLLFANVLQHQSWMHVAVAFDGNEATDPLRVYVNGTLVSPTTAITDTTGTVADGSRVITVGQASNWLQGRVHSIAIWNRELSAAEVLEIYQAGVGDQQDLNVNFSNYAGAAALRHWFRLGYATALTTMGKNYAAVSGAAAAPNLMDAAVSIDATNLSSDSPSGGKIALPGDYAEGRPNGLIITTAPPRFPRNVTLDILETIRDQATDGIPMAFSVSGTKIELADVPAGNHPYRFHYRAGWPTITGGVLSSAFAQHADLYLHGSVIYGALAIRNQGLIEQHEAFYAEARRNAKRQESRARHPGSLAVRSDTWTP